MAGKKKLEQAEKSEIGISYMSLANLKKWERNPKSHDLNVIENSIRRWGFVSPILLDERDKGMVAGHGRVTVLEKMKADNESPPGRIKIKDGDWYVPVVRGIEFMNKAEAEAYGLADNRSVELGGWDEEALAAVLSDGFEYDKEMVFELGWDEASLQRMLANVALSSDLAPTILPDPDVVGDDTRTGRFIVVYLDENEKRDILRRLGLPDDWNSVTIAVRDLTPNEDYV